MIKHRSIVKLIIFSFITFGIYSIVFWWGYINNINDACVCDGKKSPNYLIVILLSFLTCGLYYLFWKYKQEERLQSIAPEYGLEIKEGGAIVILYHLFGTMIMSTAYFAGGFVIAFSSLLTFMTSFITTMFHFDPTVMLAKIQSIMTPVTVCFLLFCCFSFFILGISLVFKSMNILIVNLNKIGKVYNEKCI